MKKSSIFSLMILLGVGLSSCFNDLNTVPLDKDILTADAVYKDASSYKKVLAKVYAGYAVSGQQGAAGQPDIEGIDEGFGQYLRGFWYHQELSTDEAVIGWNDQTIKDFHNQTWTETDGFIYAFYSRIFYQISLCNEFIRETADEKLSERGADDALKAEVKKFRAEARFLRALSYWHALDMFRNVPFVTENDKVGSFFPNQTNGVDLAKYIETELLAIENDLAAPKGNEYGRADKAAAWTLLAKLYLNYEVYTGQKKYTECTDVCQKIIASGYKLDPAYKNLFLADNHLSPEIIFPITYDGINTRTWGGTTFIIRAGIGGSMNPAASGVASGWGGSRTTRQLVEKFPADLTGIVTDFNPGETVKYKKMYVPGSHQNFDATDTDNSLAEGVKNSNIYEGHLYFASANTELYFTTISSNTAPKLGDNNADGTLETNGAKIVVPEAGLYYIRVDNKTKKYTIEKTQWFVSGAATGGSDVAMSYDTKTKTMKATLDLGAGSFNFKNNRGELLGDNSGNSILTINGTAITVGKPGGHELFLDIDKPDYTYQDRLTGFDRRPMFYTTGQNIDINDLSTFTDGIAVNKFKNITSDGQPGKDSDFPDTDFPMFRLADVYLMAAEAIMRSNGDKNQAVAYVNAVRERAYSGKVGNITAAELTYEYLLDERARELYWEGHRRTDLVRFGQFADGSYLWQWKGGVKEGKTVANTYNIFPIPSADLGANPNLKQNEGY